MAGVDVSVSYTLGDGGATRCAGSSPSVSPGQCTCRIQATGVRFPAVA